MIAHESGITETADPLGGSHAIEYLTDEIERRSFDYIEKIDAMGGMLAAIEAGYVQREIERAAYDDQKAVEAGTEVVVGVNRYEIEEAAPIPTLRIDPAGEAAQIARLREVRASRNSANAFAAIERVGEAARNGTNLMPPILAAVEAYATIGEIADALRAVFGEYSEVG